MTIPFHDRSDREISETMQYDPDAPIIVSVLIKEKGIVGTISFLRGRGFRALEQWWPPTVAVLEIAGGYFARLRGDCNSQALIPSIFQPLPVLDLNDGHPVLVRNEVVVAFGRWRDEKFRNQGWMEWRNVLYVLGPAESVRAAVKAGVPSRKNGGNYGAQMTEPPPREAHRRGSGVVVRAEFRPSSAMASVRAQAPAPPGRHTRTRGERLARQLALAHWIDRAVESGRVASYGEVARALGLTESRITKITAS